MKNPSESFKINLNQNLWGLLMAMVALGLSEYYSLSTLFYISLIASIASIISYIITLIPYTINYWRAKIKKTS